MLFGRPTVSGSYWGDELFRNEEGEWKLLHRHADPITSPRPAQSVVQT
jgi:hypothetical protein